MTEDLQKAIEQKSKYVNQIRVWVDEAASKEGFKVRANTKWVSVEDVTALLVKVSEVNTEAVQLLAKLEDWATRKHFGDFDPELVFILEKMRKVLDK